MFLLNTRTGDTWRWREDYGDNKDMGFFYLPTESRIIPRQSKQREDCFQKAVIRRGLRLMRRSALRARSFSSP